jgi:hypothetical protein
MAAAVKFRNCSNYLDKKASVNVADANENYLLLIYAAMFKDMSWLY